MYTDITSEEFQEQFQSGDKGEYQFIDVRELEEYEEAHIAGTTLIPLSEFQERFEEIAEDTPVVLVCRSGGRSAQAANFMMGMGYDPENLFNLSDGTMGWMKKGYAVE